MEDILSQYLNRLVELRIFPFAPLEVNFIISFCWVLLRGSLKAASDYRISKLEAGETAAANISTFIGFKILVFILTFLVMFVISISLNFWLTYLEWESSHISWWLPSVTAISLAEFSALLARVWKKGGVKREGEEEGEEEEEETEFERSGRTLNIYFILSFLVLALFWGFMIFKSL